MFAGHFALAAGVKSARRTPPLWSLMLASQLLDVLFVPLYLAGIETIEKVGAGGYGGGVIHANYSHSLVGALILSAVALLAGGLAWGRRSGWILAGVTFSHWVLDLLVHRADLPLLPGNWGNLPTLGLSLWQYPVLTASIELAMIAVFTAMYGVSLWRAAAHKWRAVVTTSVVGIALVAALAGDWLGIGG
jgi:hypothetical protein